MRLSRQHLLEKLALSMDGVVLTVPPAEGIDRNNFCRKGETHMWRLPSESCTPELAAGDPYSVQIPMNRAVPLWAGISEGGAAEVVVHKYKRMTAPEWLKAVKAGKLKGAVPSLKPQGKRPWL